MMESFPLVFSRNTPIMSVISDSIKMYFVFISESWQLWDNYDNQWEIMPSHHALYQSEK